MRLKSSMASKQGSTGNDGDGKRKNRNVETKMEADGQKMCIRDRYQHQMKSAMKHPAGDTKGRENMSDLHGSRIGMMEFRDPNAQMDSDLTGKDNDTVAQTEKETSAYPNGQTNAGNETPMEEAMQEPKGTGGQDADASMEAMERDLEPESVDSSGAVSYTHLDVYKRQGYCSLVWLVKICLAVGRGFPSPTVAAKATR